MNSATVRTWTRILAAAGAALALVSCAWEKEVFDAPAGSGEAMVTFSLRVPGASAPASRALSAANENAVGQIDVLVFEPSGGEFVYRAGVSGMDIDTDGSDSRVKTFTVALRQGSFDLALVANARTEVSAASLAGLTKAEALAALETAVPAGGKWLADAAATGYRPLPMWGDVGNIAINDATDLTGDDRVLLTRMSARVVVQATGDAAANFRIAAVDIYNYNTRGTLAPKPADWNTTVPSAPKAVRPNVPATSVLTEGPIHYTAATPATSYAGEIYIFEAENHVAPAHTAGKPLASRTCAVVGGHWDSDADADFTDEGAATWYRVDFSTGTGASQVFLDVLRNHSYTFNITKVSGPGYADSETAFNSAPVNIEAGVVEWNDTGLAVADGQYSLSVGSAAVSLDGRAYTADDAENKLRIRTDHPDGWTVAGITDDATNAAIPDGGWLSIAAADKTGTDKTVSLVLAPNLTGAARSATVRVTAGRMTLTVAVTQGLPASGYGGYADVLFFGTGDVLSVGRWADMSADQRANLAYFKFGGTVGFTGVTEGWMAAHIAGELKFNTTGNTGYATWQNIPYYGAADFAAGRTNVSATTGDRAYHTGENVKAGKGDPCRLVGLTGAQIQAMTAEQVSAYNSGWRMPTVGENKAFTGHAANATTSAHWTNVGGMDGGMFPDATAGTPDMFLPAHGYRAISNGSHQQGGAHGHYWSNSAATGSPNTTAHALYLSAALVSVDNTVGVSMGYNVRCVRQDGATPPPPAAVLNSRITWDGSKYALTTDPSDAGLYFKFGGVAGVYSADHTVQTLPGANGDTFDAGDVAWSPTTVTAWASVPSYVAADYPNMVTAPVYHNATNVKAGKGDPCRLVGLDLARIATTAAGSLTAADIDNGQWRLPTNAETQTFSGQTSNNGSYTAHWTTVGGVNGGMFPNATDGSAATFLPVAGYRSTSGGVNSQGSSGYYWSSQAGSSSNGYSLGFHSSRVYPMGSNDYAYGFPVRCVRQDGATPPPPAAVLAHSSNTVPASGIIPMEGGTYTVNVSTNLQDWEVRVYEGSNPVPIVTKAANPSPAIDRNAAPVASTTTVAVPTNLLATATADRSLSFVLHSSEGGEVRLGSFIQRGYNRDGDNRRITWDEVTGRYLLTTDPTDGGLYFTFGGVAGLYSGNGGIKRLSSAANTDSDDFDAGDVAWSPVAIPVNDGLPGVPIYEEDDFPADVTPADGYHTAANVKRGKGDPCRLVGLDLGRIASTPAASLSAADIDNGQWRLPTEQENNAFSGTEGYSSDAHWTSIDMTYGGMFPNATLGNTGTFLPAAGYRSGGTAMDYNYSGYYLSSHADEVADGLALTTLLMFDEYSVPFYHLYADEGAYSVRCVRQQEGDRAVDVAPVTPPQNYRVTWDGGSGRYTLTDNPTDAGLYFKFGGVAGVYSANHAVATLPATNADPFDAGDVAWSPTTVTTWASVPVYADYPANVDAAYHTAANVKAGKGDPCRLVGLDLARIKATAAGSLTNADIDNGTWRLPTNAENQSLSGQMSNNDSYSAHWMTAATGPGGVAGGMFPNVASGSTATFFPAAGFRFSDTGTVGRQTTAGDYWSFAPISAVGGYTLYFASGNVSPLVENYYDHGFPVRCVRQ